MDLTNSLVIGLNKIKELDEELLCKTLLNFVDTEFYPWLFRDRGSNRTSGLGVLNTVLVMLRQMPIVVFVNTTGKIQKIETFNKSHIDLIKQGSTDDGLIVRIV